MIAAPVVAFGEIDQLSAHAGRPLEARELAQPPRHLPVMVAVDKPGRRFARRYQARPAHEPRGAVTDEWIAIFKQLWSQSPASFEASSANAGVASLVPAL